MSLWSLCGLLALGRLVIRLLRYQQHSVGDNGVPAVQSWAALEKQAPARARTATQHPVRAGAWFSKCPCCEWQGRGGACVSGLVRIRQTSEERIDDHGATAIFSFILLEHLLPQTASDQWQKGHTHHQWYDAVRVLCQSCRYIYSQSQITYKNTIYYYLLQLCFLQRVLML